MDNILQEHFQKILSKDTKGILSDFSENLVSIIHVDGTSKTMTYYPSVQLLQSIIKDITSGSLDEKNILVNRCTPDCGVLTLRSRSFAPFLSYTCIVKDGKISYFTLYVFSPKKKITPAAYSEMKKGRQVKHVFHKHFLAMFSMNADVITKDYRDDAVVITNMAKTVCSGKEEIHTFCSHLMKSSWKIMKKIKIHGFPMIKWNTKSIPDGIMLLVCEAKALGTVMTETYYVKDGKIQFESSICGGRMLKPIHQILK
ncbi:MAG: hypothetical protein Q4D16_00695 [Eubacteriales bacterium]|nr:hypothetical protein [Eubacteriales bacterium]